jgi:phage terminase small subunit
MPTKRTKKDALAREERFCVEYATNGGNGTKAAEDAGYSAKSRPALATCASKLLRKGNVQDRLNELRLSFQKLTEVKVETLARELLASIHFDPTGMVEHRKFTQKEIDRLVAEMREEDQYQRRLKRRIVAKHNSAKKAGEKPDTIEEEPDTIEEEPEEDFERRVTLYRRRLEREETRFRLRPEKHWPKEALKHVAISVKPGRYGDSFQVRTTANRTQAIHTLALLCGFIVNKNDNRDLTLEEILDEIHKGVPPEKETGKTPAKKR